MQQSITLLYSINSLCIL